MKNFLLTLTAAGQLTGFACFGVLMHDVISSGNAGRARLHHSSATISNLALGALILPGLAVLPLAAAQRGHNREERV